ncbi:MAG: hypothetical protein GY793_03270 [Proteobacteria bacterium]|nr:hypothetical protein [Pseudomonadota bacterium]
MSYVFLIHITGDSNPEDTISKKFFKQAMKTQSQVFTLDANTIDHLLSGEVTLFKSGNLWWGSVKEPLPTIQGEDSLSQLFNYIITECSPQHIFLSGDKESKKQLYECAESICKDREVGLFFLSDIQKEGTAANDVWE